MKEIIASAYITEVNRYDFIIRVDDDLTVEQEKEQGLAKLKAFLDNNTQSPHQIHFIDGVLCYDSESSIRCDSKANIEYSI